MPGGFYTPELGATDESQVSRRQLSYGSEWSFIPPGASRSIAPLTSLGQAYYWTRAWQDGEQESLAALARGEGRTFEDAQSAIRYLLSDE
jgi:hypothetical protein